MRIAENMANCYYFQMDVKQVRVANLRRHIKARAKGNQSQFSSTFGFNAAHISQMLTGHPDIGDKIARKLEQALGLSHGEMDQQFYPDQLQELPPNARQVAVDWLLLVEPLKSQISEAIRSAAQVTKDTGGKK